MFRKVAWMWLKPNYKLLRSLFLLHKIILPFIKFEFSLTFEEILSNIKIKPREDRSSTADTSLRTFHNFATIILG